jgi:hypothetical protein
MTLFDDPMGEHRSACVKEVKDAVLDALIARANFVNTIAKSVGLWAAQLMTKLGQPLDPDDALVLDLPRETVKPGEKRAVSIGFGIEDDLGLRQSSLPLDYRIIAIRRQVS